MTDDAKTVLVVDDDPDAREYLSTVLQDNGFTATTANDGVQAIASLEQQIPDLVTLDISMPEKSGVAVYRKLKEDERLKSVPVIIVTGISEEFERFISTRRQVPPPEAYVSKPVDAEDFVRKVKKLLA
ncbi:MAG: response regulator [Gemmatimonadales bacterium]|jgi:twitching motility two-component system response regulator PilH